MRTLDDAFRASIAIDARLYKASFGGDRSAAGRYAAEQRWKGHTKGDISQKVTIGFDPRGYKNDSGTVWATDKETGKVIGALSFEADFIGKVYVLPEYRRKGIAKYLYEEAKKRNGGLEMKADDYSFSGAAFMSAVTGRTHSPTMDFEPSMWLKGYESDGLNKASFGGDRSAAGRYAAEQRWKGHVKRELKISDAERLAGDKVLIQRKWGIDKMPALKNVSTEALLRLVNNGEITAGVPYASIDTDLSDPFLGNTNSLKIEETPQNDRTAIVHHLAAGIVRNWESSASRTSALLAKKATKDAFGLTDTAHVMTAEELPKEDAETLGAVVKAMYERTQQHLQETGFNKNSEVTLYRSTVLPFRVKVNEVVDYQTAPLTSFTTEEKIANDFAKNNRGSVVKANIARSQIFFINNVMMTGGWMGEEKEVIVLGGKLETTVVSAQPLRRRG
jgi:GNAT superfamily N-acetyltransferase